MRKKVLLDLRWFRPGVTGGIEEVVRILLQNISNSPIAAHDYYLLIPSAGKKSLPQNERNAFRYLITDGLFVYIKRMLGEACRRLRISTCERWQRLSKITDEQIENLSPDGVVSFLGYIDPGCYQYKNLLVLLDLAHENLPELFSEDELNFRRENYPKSMERAEKILAISDFTKKTAVSLLPEIKEKIEVSYLGPNDYFITAPEPTEAEKRNTLQKYHLEDCKYIIYPANSWPHKNHKILVEAIALLNRENYNIHAVFTGSHKQAHHQLIEQIQNENMTDYIHMVGYVSYQDLRNLYYQAEMLVFPSLYEGFGIPLLEAMWCHCPVITSSSSSLPEVAGDAALYFDPNSVNELVEQIKKINNNPELKARLIDLGDHQKLEFSNATFAQSLLKNLELILE